VNERQGSITRIAAPIRTFAYRFAYVGLVGAAIVFILVGKMEPAAIERARAQVTDALAPILDVASRPFDAAKQGVAELQAALELREENARLREERDRLIEWQAAARRLESENKSLRELLAFVPSNEVQSISARVIGDSGGAFARTMLLNAGSRAGVRKGQAVVTGAGLVGRIQEVGGLSSRILLLTDLNSRIPVIMEGSRVRSVAAGTNGEFLRLVHLPPNAVIEAGERVVTSGHGGALPVGLPIGVVVVSGDGAIEVRPYIDPSRLELVRILEYGLDGILDLPMTPRPEPQRRIRR